MLTRVATSTLALVLCCFFSSCTNKSTQITQQFQYHDDGIAKPRIAMVPVYNNSKANIQWSLSDELTEAFSERIYQSGSFYLTKDFDMLGVQRFPLHEINPFLDDIDWLAEVDSGTDFIVFLELVSHNLAPNGYNLKLFQSYSLDMSMRIKVVDIRQKKPTVILHEMVEETYSVPWGFTNFAYQKGRWNKTAFSYSPIGVAHSKMVKRVAKQVEDYILLAKMH